MSQNFIDENGEWHMTCPICADVLSLERSTIINCGHVYHFDCMQNQYEYDWNHGKTSACAICRAKILSKPIIVYAKDSKKPFDYMVFKDCIHPNKNGGKQKKGAVASVQNYNNDEHEELIEFYDGRLRDMEGQLREMATLRNENGQLKIALMDNNRKLRDMRIELDERNLKMNRLINKQRELEELLAQERLMHEAVRNELDSYQYMRISSEVTRLTSEISRIQTESYYRNLISDPSVDKTQLVGMLAGMRVKVKESEDRMNEMSKEIRDLTIFKEKTERLDRERDRERDRVHKNGGNLHEIDIHSLDINAMESEKATIQSPTTDSPSDRFEEPLHRKSPPNLSTRMVPRVAPKGFQMPTARGGVNTGTGKRTKVMDVDGKPVFFS